MTKNHFRSILRELMDENPFAIRAVLKILEVVFTRAVRTLAVTCEDRPRLLVNLEFISANCATEKEVKAVVCHEFLHVILRHTEERRHPTPARHLAADAVINAIIHRQCGAEYSSFMSRYYANAPNLHKLLRPMNRKERSSWDRNSWAVAKAPPQWASAWNGLYKGSLVADDIEALASQAAEEMAGPAGSKKGAGPFVLESGGIGGPEDLLGNHEDLDKPLPAPLERALRKAMREMNGEGIWRSPRQRGVGANADETLVMAEDRGLVQWRKTTLAVLKRHLLPDPRSQKSSPGPGDYLLPVLSQRDRRAFTRSLWTPFLPEALWEGTRPVRNGTAQVYLDVSGSMNAEMPLVIELLWRLSRHIRRPFWAFSDKVAPAVISGGKLKTETTGGTSMECVLEHLRKTRPDAAVVVTDGYIEKLDPTLVASVRGTRLHALVTRDGSPAEMRRCGIPHTQLPGLKGGSS